MQDLRIKPKKPGFYRITGFEAVFLPKTRFLELIQNPKSI
jgi:hypothetical protein